MTNIDFINKVAGKPWVDRSSGPDSYDCWGLVIDSFKSIDNVAIKEVSGYSSGSAIEDIGTTVQADFAWKELDRPIDGSVFCVYLSNGQMVHVGRVLYVNRIGLYAVHAYVKNGVGQVTPEPMRDVAKRYEGKIKYFMRPKDA
jgi:cell wall-associated NlpC family hydrolase